MKLLRFSVYLLAGFLSAMSIAGCAVDEPDYREKDYGYVQFKLYKQASYTKADLAGEPLEYLSDASKIRVTLGHGDQLIDQTLTFSYADVASAEFGIRSEKLKLLAGEYSLRSFTIFNKKDEPVYENRMPKASFTVVPGGLEVLDVLADTWERGTARFRLVKGMVLNDRPDLKSAGAGSRASGTSAYTFDEIGYVDIELYNISLKEDTPLRKLPAEFVLDFDYSANEGSDGLAPQTSYALCDSTVKLKAGEYELRSYSTFNKSKKLLELNTSPYECRFVVSDNELSEVDVKITMSESAPYIQDYYALYRIWKALGGDQWYYVGENFKTGANWNFNKDPDLWGDQPGVQLHSNGRVALIDLSNFGFYGEMPDELGNLTELVELYLGTHDDTNLYTYQSKDYNSNSSRENRMQRARDYLLRTHPAVQFSEPIARAMAEKGVRIRETQMYDSFKESEIIDRNTGLMKVRPMDTNPGTIANGLTRLPESMGNLKNLQKLCIANSELSELPESFKQLESCTDVELYNLPNMKQFPEVLAHMPALVQVNLSCNPQWGETASTYTRHDGTAGNQADYGLNALSHNDGNDGDGLYNSYKSLQMIYMNECGLSEVTRNISNVKSLGLLSLSHNKIDKIYPFGSDIVMVQLYLDHNRLTKIESDGGVFCGMDDVENISFSNNLLTELPDIFTAKSLYTMTSVDFSNNLITGVEKNGPDGKYQGINVETLTLTNNPIEVYPVEFAESESKINYINFRGCRISEIPEKAFEGRNVKYLMSLDLSYNDLDDLPKSFQAVNMPYFYGLELSYNEFSKFPFEPLDCSGLTVFGIRGQRDADGERCLSEWPTGIYQHTGLRGFYIGSNNLGKIEDTISPICYYLEISDNPNIVFDASNVCYEYSIGAYYLIYDKTQDIRGCEIMK